MSDVTSDSFSSASSRSSVDTRSTNFFPEQMRDDLLQRLYPSLLVARPWFLDRLVKLNVVSTQATCFSQPLATHGSTLE